MDRRAFLRWSALVGAVAVAGCSGSDDAADPETDAEPTSTASPTTQEENDSGTLSEEDFITPPGPPCEALGESTFRSIEQQPGGPAPEGESSAFHWRVRFSEGEYSYTHTDVVESGTYTCTGEGGTATIEASPDATDETHTGTYDADSGVLTWDGVEYRPVETN